MRAPASLALLVLIGCAAERDRAPLTANQVVVVTTTAWNSVDATLRRFERDAARGAWVEVGTPMRAVVGKNGLAWGRGVHEARSEGPEKREGDGRAPAGVFPFVHAFGYAERARVPFVRMPYEQVTKTWVCVDDPASRNYNRVFDALGGPPLDWNSAETMLREDPLYALGLVIGHNQGGVAGGGSCIFLHSWSGPSLGTAGCTALAAADVEVLLRWLDPRQSPHVVQVPFAELDLVRRTWPGLRP